MFNIGGLGDAISKVKDKVKEKAGSEMKKKTGKGKDKFKGFLADLAGGPGLLNDGGSKYNKDQKPYTTKEEAVMDATEKSADNIAETTKPKKAEGATVSFDTPMARLSTDYAKGGGFKMSNDSPMDRGGMSENASAMWRKKKGYNW